MVYIDGKLQMDMGAMMDYGGDYQVQSVSIKKSNEIIIAGLLIIKLMNYAVKELKIL